MQGRSRVERELLDAESMVGELVPPGGVYAFLAEHRGELFPDSFIADLFSAKTGRPSLPADLIGSVLVLKELNDMSDPQTAEALKYDIRWKVACGRALTETSFDPSTLVYWRRRIAESERPDRVFEAVDAVIAETGVLRGKRKRCVDSTVFDDAVATQDTVTQLVAAMRKVARLVPGAQEVVSRVARLDYSKPGKPQIDWDDPDAKQQLVSDLVNDALAVLAELTSPDAPEREDKAADALGLLALVAGQDVEPAEDSDGTDGRWRIVRRVAPDRVISVVDTETRHTRTSKANRKDGFRGHIAAEPSTGLITDCELTKASGEQGSDATVGEKMIARDRYHRADTGAVCDGADPAAPADEDPGDRRCRCGATGYDRTDASRTGTIRVGRRRHRRGGHRRRCRSRAAPGSGGVRRLGLRHRRGARRLRPGRARHRDQSQAAASGRARRVHPRRLRHRRAGRHGDLPGRAHPHHEPEADGHLRRGVRRLPTASPVHHRQRRAVDEHPRARGIVARRPRAGPHTRVQTGLPHPLERRANRRLDRHQPRTADQAALPGRGKEPRLAENPLRRNQSPNPHQQRSGPHRRGMGTGLTTGVAPLARCGTEPSRPDWTPAGEVTTLSASKDRLTPQ